MPRERREDLDCAQRKSQPQVISKPEETSMSVATHEVVNQPYALADYNLFAGYAALKASFAR